MSNVVPITSARGTTESRTMRELRRLLHHAHAYLDARDGEQRPSRADVLTFEQFQRAPLRTSIFGYPL